MGCKVVPLRYHPNASQDFNFIEQIAKSAALPHSLVHAHTNTSGGTSSNSTHIMPGGAPRTPKAFDNLSEMQ